MCFIAVAMSPLRQASQRIWFLCNVNEKSISSLTMASLKSKSQIELINNCVRASSRKAFWNTFQGESKVKQFSARVATAKICAILGQLPLLFWCWASSTKPLILLSLLNYLSIVGIQHFFFGNWQLYTCKQQLLALITQIYIYIYTAGYICWCWQCISIIQKQADRFRIVHAN